MNRINRFYKHISKYQPSGEVLASNATRNQVSIKPIAKGLNAFNTIGTKVRF